MGCRLGMGVRRMTSLPPNSSTATYDDLAEITSVSPPQRVGFQNSAAGVTCGSGCAFVVVDQPSQYRLAPDPLVVEAVDGVIGSRRDKSQRAMWRPTVVVGAVLGEDGPQVPLAEDQDAVGELGSGGQDESFGEAVRSRTARRDLHDVDPGAGQDGVERGGELAGAVADEEPEGGGTVVERHQ
jgi:hypothetical protein